MFRLKDRQKCAELFKRYYSGQKFHDDFYRDLIRKYLRQSEYLLDAGCGRYFKFCKELSDTARVVGFDLNTTIETRSVVEHLAGPAREFWPDFAPGRQVVFVTANKFNYVSIIASITPQHVRRSLVSRVFYPPNDDVFPTRYRVGARREAVTAAGFLEKEFGTIKHYPAYLMCPPVIFRLGVSVVNSLHLRCSRCCGLRFCACWRESRLSGPTKRPAMTSVLLPASQNEVT
jgi:hypothetical protein